MTSRTSSAALPLSTIAACARAVAVRDRLAPLVVETSDNLVLVRCPREPWERIRHTVLLNELARHLAWLSLPGLSAQGGQDEHGAYLKITGVTPAQ